MPFRENQPAIHVVQYLLIAYLVLLILFFGALRFL
jgi:hypothetical protein